MVGLFVLAVTASYFWGGSEASLPPDAASFNKDRGDRAVDVGEELAEGHVQPIAAIDSEDLEPQGVEEQPLEVSEFEKALGIVKAQPSRGSTVDDGLAVAPFIVGEQEQDSTEPDGGNRHSNRPLAPRFDEGGTPEIATPWPRNAAGNREPDLRTDSDPLSADFTPWQPNLAAGSEATTHAPINSSDRDGVPPVYSSWPGSTGAGQTSSTTPPSRDPTYTAFNPRENASREVGGPPPGSSHQNPPAVWSPGNPYAVPNSVPRGHSPTPNFYQY